MAVQMKERAPSALATPTDITQATSPVGEALNKLVADSFALFVKTKNFHWHVSGPHFRDYHLMLDEQAAQVLETIDVLAERARKIGSTTVRSIGHISQLTRVEDDDRPFVPALQMLRALHSENLALVKNIREAHGIADEHDDIATASLLEELIDQAEGRAWFLFETTRADAQDAG